MMAAPLAASQHRNKCCTCPGMQHMPWGPSMIKLPALNACWMFLRVILTDIADAGAPP